MLHIISPCSFRQVVAVDGVQQGQESEGIHMCPVICRQAEICPILGTGNMPGDAADVWFELGAEMMIHRQRLYNLDLCCSASGIKVDRCWFSKRLVLIEDNFSKRLVALCIVPGEGKCCAIQNVGVITCVADGRW